jgi:hypothetical protein
MEINTSDNSVYVGEFRGDTLLIVTGSYLESCLWRLEMMGDVTQGFSMEHVAKKFGSDEVREALRDPLLAAWLESEDDADEDADEAPKSFMPDNDLIRDQEAWSYSAPMLDDSEWLPENLPAELLEIAHFPEISPMTGYDPCNWAIGQRDLVWASLEAGGFSVLDGAEYFEKYKELWKRL